MKDLTQEIFFKAYRNYEKYTENGKIRAWLAVIAHNMLKNHYKAEQYQNSYVVLSPIEYISDELLPSKNMLEDIVIQQEFLDKIMKIINSLPEKQRDVIIYSCLYDYSEKEIASIQNMSLSAVKSAKYFGLQKVRKFIGEDYEYDADTNKKHKVNKYGRYKMIKCYTYADNGNFTEHTELQRDSLIELISPSEKEIAEVAKFLEYYDVNRGGKISEDIIKALVNGEFDKIKSPATKVNGVLNILVEREYIIICHDGKIDEHRKIIENLSKIWTLLNVPGYINLDFLDVSMLMSGAKAAYAGSGRGRGENKAAAVENALSSSPLLAENISKACGIIFDISASPNIKLDDVDIIGSEIFKRSSGNCPLIFGVSFDNELNDELIVTIIAVDKDE